MPSTIPSGEHTGPEAAARGPTVHRPSAGRPRELGRLPARALAVLHQRGAVRAEPVADGRQPGARREPGRGARRPALLAGLMVCGRCGRGPGPPPRPAGRIRAGRRSRTPSAPDPHRSPAPARRPSPARPPARPARTAAASTPGDHEPGRRWTGARRPQPADHGARPGPPPPPAPTAASSSRSPPAPPPGTYVDRTIRSTSRLSNRSTSTRLTSGNASHGGTPADTSRLWGATQPLPTPPTSRVRPGRDLPQPPHDHDDGQQPVNSDDGGILRPRPLYTRSVACILRP